MLIDLEGMVGGAIAGIVIGVCCYCCCIGAGVFMMMRKRGKSQSGGTVIVTQN